MRYGVICRHEDQGIHKPKLRDAHKNITLGRLKEASRKVFYSKNYDAVSIDEIAAEAGVSRGTVYSHFSSKSELLFDLLNDDLAAQMKLYEQLAALRKADRRAIRAWLEAYRASMHERRISNQLFPMAFRSMPERASSIGVHRDTAIAKLGKRYPGFDLNGLQPGPRERKRAQAYMMLFSLEQVAYVFSSEYGAPDIEVGLDILADKILAFCVSG